jgi:enterochelin esterase-like enzyme
MIMNAKLLTFLLLFICLTGVNVNSQEHKWINDFPEMEGNGLLHRTYYSKIHNTSIGYTIALPKDYFKEENTDTRYPVVYCLHGGAPGNESQILWYKLLVEPIVEKSSSPPMIYVWNNGGKHNSHYDFPQFNSYAESTFIKELISHIDSTYRTFPERTARGLQGYSMGGRAAARYIFKYPELFSVSIAIAGGHQWEKENSKTNGNNGEYQPKDNSWNLAKIYAKSPNPPIKLFVFVGSNDMNYQANIDWTAYLRKLKIHHSITIVEGVGHKEIEKMFDQLGICTIHYIMYQNFKDAVDNNSD